ncbi:multidrug resistance integral membrane efflux domain protein [Mycobacterium ulcerans str. Harvey]|uniref:Multidrug resistance integral membrane efflux domain protein n=1 Tax=Mycobacterium ulcerans str. Harvey TaxID=1299332 RepID=A0ABP3AQR7_MYCUL|nr:multidrug resistance integral membrane efflux domain protein [Mycobacterium ulcerans str. Harvey]
MGRLPREPEIGASTHAAGESRLGDDGRPTPIPSGWTPNF